MSNTDKQIQDRDKKEVAVVVGSVVGVRIGKDLFDRIITERIKKGIVSIGEGIFSRANYEKSALAHEILPNEFTAHDILTLPQETALKILGGTEDAYFFYAETKRQILDAGNDPQRIGAINRDIEQYYSKRVEKYLLTTNEAYAKQQQEWAGLNTGRSVPEAVEMKEMSNPFMTTQEKTQLYQQSIQKVEAQRKAEDSIREELENPAGETKVSVIDDAINRYEQEGLTRTEAIQKVEQILGDKAPADIKSTLEEQATPDLTNNEGIELTDMSPEIKTATDLQTAQEEAFQRIAKAEGINTGVPKIRSYAEADDIYRNIVLSQVGRDKQLAKLFGQKGFLDDPKMAKLFGDLGHITNVGLLGWSVVSLSEDLATGKKLNGYDIANYVNNIGAGATYSVLSLAGSSLASSFGWATMGVGGLLAIGEMTANNYEKEKNAWKNADSIIDKIGSVGSKIQNLVNHKNEMKHTINLMNNYGNLYYKYILNYPYSYGGYNTQPQFNYKKKYQPYTTNSSYNRFRQEGIANKVLDRFTTDPKMRKALDEQVFSREFERFDSMGRPLKEIGDSGKANQLVDFLNADDENKAQQEYIKKIYGYTDNNIHNLVRYKKNTILETTDDNLQRHFEDQVKLTRGYSDKLSNYKDRYNQLIRKSMDTNYNKEVAIGMEQKKPQSFFDNLKQSHEAMINNPKFFMSDGDAENGMGYMKMNRIKKLAGVPVPQLPFWCYMYHANADLYRLQDFKIINDKIKKAGSHDEPLPDPPFNPKPPKPAPDDPHKPEPDDPKPDPKPDPDDPDKPKPKPPKPPFNPPVTPDDPDKPKPKPKPFNPNPPSRDFRDDKFAPNGETSYDDVEIEFNPELALYLLRLVEKAYQPRTQFIRVNDEL